MISASDGSDLKLKVGDTDSHGDKVTFIFDRADSKYIIYLVSSGALKCGDFGIQLQHHPTITSPMMRIGDLFAVNPKLASKYNSHRALGRVDFALSSHGKVRIGLEVNFYTTSGSKPSEIKRAYQSVNRELSMVGVELVWITDGAGYLKMKRGLREAFEAHRNTYNYEMANRYLKDDIHDFLNKVREK